MLQAAHRRLLPQGPVGHIVSVHDSVQFNLHV